MNFTKKMVLVPFQQGTGVVEKAVSEPPVMTSSSSSVAKQKKENSNRRYAVDRQRKLLSMILKLALHGGYDANGMIVCANGDTTDIVPLIMYAGSPGRNVKGMTDFVNLLYDAGVEPELVINTLVRELLHKRIRDDKRPFVSKPPLSTVQLPTVNVPAVESQRKETDMPPPKRAQEEEIVSRPRSVKRKRTPDDVDDEPSKKFNFDWDQSDSDLDER